MARAIKLKNLSEDPFFKIEYEQIFKFEKYLDDREAEILEILELDNDNLDVDKRRVNFIAKMNSGKTYSTIKMALDNQLKMIFIVPLQVIAQQNRNKFVADRLDVFAIHGQIGENIKAVTIDNIKMKIGGGTKVFLSVYDSLKKFFHEDIGDIFNPSEYILVVDESHNLITEHEYRYEAINFIRDVEHEFKRVIYLTGTPEGVIDPKNRSFKFERKEPIKINENINLIKYEKNRYPNVKDNLLYHLFNMLINDKTEKQIVVLLDDKSSLSRLESALSSHYDGSKTIKILDSSLKNDDHYIHIAEKEEIQDSIDILLTTRVISEGVNISNDIGSVYLIDLNSSYWTKRQFLGRFRNNIDKIFELHSDSTKEYLYLTKLVTGRNNDFQDAVNYIKYLKGKFESAKDMNPSLTIEDFVDSDSYGTDESVYFSTKNGKFKTSMDFINNKTITKINRALHSSILLTEKFYKDLAGYEVNLSDYESNVDDEISYDKFELLVNDFCTGSFKDNPQVLELHFTKLLTVHCFNELLKDKYILPDIIPFMDFNILLDDEKVKDINACLKGQNKIIMGDAYKLLVGGYPKGIVIELLLFSVNDRANYNRLMRKLLINSSISVVQNHPEFKECFMHDRLKKDYAYSLDLFSLINSNPIITKPLRIVLEQNIARYRLYPDVSNRTIALDYMQACFSTTRIGREKNYNIDSIETISGLLEKSGIFISDHDSLYLKDIPIIKFRNDIRKLMHTVNTADREIFQKAFDSIEIPVDRIIALKILELNDRIKELEQNSSNKYGKGFSVRKIFEKVVEPRNLSLGIGLIPIIRLLLKGVLFKGFF